jgi:membrane fusion protein
MQAQADLKQAIAATKLNLDSNERELLALKRPEADNESRQSIAIKAPQDGTITAIAVEDGYPVTVNQPLAKLVPPDRLLVELYVPSRSAGFVKKGTKVQLAYDAWAYQKYGLQDAAVIEVTKAATSFQEMTLPGAQQAAQGEAGFRIRILPLKQTFTVDAEEKPLKSGMSVEARLVQDERTLVRWLFENLWTIRANM